MIPYGIGFDVWVVIFGQFVFLVGLLYWVARKNRRTPQPDSRRG